VQEKMSDGDFKATEKVIRETMDEFGTKSAALEKQFMEDFKAIVTAEQSERWPAVERHRRRETRLNTPSYSGAALDLIKIVQRTKTDPGVPEFATLLEQYEMAIDRQLQENSRRAESLPAEKEGDAFDPERQEKLLKLMGENGLALRNLNRDYAARLAGLMTEDARKTFELEVAKRSYSQVYSKTHIGECLEAAAGFSDLDTNQKATLEQIKQQFERELAPLNLAWSDAISKGEEEAGGAMQMQMKQWQGGGVDPAIKEARDARRELEKRTRARLDELLTPAQEDRLPAKKKSDAQGGFGNVRINVGGGEIEEEAE
jgi:hypothetical protein